ncbi:hypothetical protein XarbCFBP7629_13850 [Xanthomonas arboricola]|nr:hypothetical protein XarbCFBP7629_13850 [Xanthomonas arboricola]
MDPIDHRVAQGLPNQDALFVGAAPAARGFTGKALAARAAPTDCGCVVERMDPIDHRVAQGLSGKLRSS